MERKTFGASPAFLLAGLVFSAATTAQTREETEAWILEQAAGNRYELQHVIEEGQFISRVTLRGLVGETTIAKAIPIHKVTRITFVHTRDYLSYSLMCDEPCAYLLDEPESKRPKFLFEIYVALDSSFAPRMNAALLHLIKSYGGKARIERARVAAQPY